MTRPEVSVRRTAGFVFYNIAATLVLLLVLEGMASIYYTFHDAFESRPFAESLYTEYDRDLGWVNLPNVYLPNVYGPGKYLRTNSQRFRNNVDFTKQVPSGKTRIICSGDSFTLGYGVDNDHTWSQLLATRAPNIETVNMGQGGYGADQAYLWYKRDGAAFDHDMQIFALISADLYRMQNPSFIGYGKPLLAVKNDQLVITNVPVPVSMEAWSPRLARAQNALSNLSITRILRRTLRLDTAAAVTPTASNQETARVFSYMLDDLCKANRVKNSVLVLVYLPTREDWILEGSWRKVLADYARQRGLLYLDLFDDFHRLPPDELDRIFIARGTIDFRGAAGHYTEAGNAYVADLIYRRLLANPETAAKLHTQPVSAAP
ncbi:MAG TPA: hypothetical protein VII95_08990 [Terriglobales bacterium]|jgi:lysophospholipase L1-like esterase